MTRYMAAGKDILKNIVWTKKVMVATESKWGSFARFQRGAETVMRARKSERDSQNCLRERHCEMLWEKREKERFCLPQRQAKSHTSPLLSLRSRHGQNASRRAEESISLERTNATNAGRTLVVPSIPIRTTRTSRGWTSRASRTTRTMPS